jgi:carboxylesterase
MHKQCVLIHGFTGGPYEIAPLAEALSREGFEMEVPSLTGHGQGRKEMLRSNRKDWMDSAEQSCARLFAGPKDSNELRVLIGFSMGSLIAAKLANRYDADKLVMISPPLYYPNPKQLLLDGVRFINGTDRGAEKYFKQYSRKIRNTPLRSAWEFRRLVSECAECLSEIHIPTLILQGELDHVVRPRSAQKVYDQIGSDDKEMHYFRQSRHHLILDKEQDQVIDCIRRFLSERRVKGNANDTEVT